MEKKKTKKEPQKSKWTPPKGASAYFSAASDYEFKNKHPVSYFFLVILSLIALMLPIVLYSIFVILNITTETFGIFLLLPLATVSVVKCIINFILYGTMLKAIISKADFNLKRIMKIIWIVVAVFSGLSAVYDDGSSLFAVIIAECIIYVPTILYLHWYTKNYDYY